MTNEELILARLDRLERQLAPIAETARAFQELKVDLAPRLNEAAHAMITELADVEADFQLEDLLFFLKKALRNVKNFNFSLDQLKNLIDFALTAEPLLKSSIPQVIFWMDELERNGVFRLLQAGVATLKQIGSQYTAEELEHLGEGLVRLLEIVQKLNNTETLAFLERASDLPAAVDLQRVKDVGPFAFLGALGDPRARAGLGVLLELTRALAALKPQNG